VVCFLETSAAVPIGVLIFVPSARSRAAEYLFHSPHYHPRRSCPLIADAFASALSSVHVRL
jgi:hypothetical protein